MKDNQTKNLKPETQNLLKRSPIVVVMGHIDHGKTTLLDYIRKTTVASKEAGGITQSIGAYEIEHNEKKVTFIDTPGHEAFSKMRTRGAKVADLAILVVAADDGVKPQTKEVIQVLKQTETPFVVAINKIDKSNADPERVKQELMQEGVLLEGFGGNVSWHAISAKTGEGVGELLDLILLTAEMENLTYNPEGETKGIIIEAKMDSRRGLTAVAIVKDGILKVGDEITTQSALGKVKILENFLGERVEELAPSSPALILGFGTMPQIGEEFFAGQVELGEVKSQKTEESAVAPIIGESGKNGQPVLPLFLKADVSGSLEALSQVIKTLPNVRIVQEAIGDITDGDIKNALSTSAIIVGFKAKSTKAADNLAKAQGIKIITSEIIYELLKTMDEEIEARRRPAPLGEVEILATFSQKGRRQVIGGRVQSGIVKINSEVKVFRGESQLGVGRIINLQKEKKDISQTKEGEECGILFESEVFITVGDKLVYQP